jgi:hypothetical protein
MVMPPLSTVSPPRIIHHFLIKVLPSAFDKFIDPSLLNWETAYVWRAL